MTRFARSKGSKSSNERIPDAGTPWSVLSQQIHERKNSSFNNEDEKIKVQFETERRSNYGKFLKEEAMKKFNKSWCEFPDKITNKTNLKAKKQAVDIKNKKGNEDEPLSSSRQAVPEHLDNNDEIHKLSQKKRNKNKTSKDYKKGVKYDTEDMFDIDDPELSQWCDEYSNEESNTKYKELTSQLRKLCKKSIKENNCSKDEATSLTCENVISESKHIKRKRKHLNPDKICEDEEQDVSTCKKGKVKSNDKLPDQLNAADSKNDKKGKKKREGIQFIDPVEVKSGGGKNVHEKIHNNNIKKNEEKVEKHARRKPELGKINVIINGEEVEIVNLQGFPVTSKDADRILQLRKSLVSRGIPRSEVERTIKLERRRAEKALARLKRALCFHCRKGGHLLSECPEMNKDSGFVGPVSGICFKCGSTEHMHFKCKVVRTQDYKFAQCFICKEQGHISGQCPDNPKGIYPKGGACRVCGDVTHLRKDCPKVAQENETNAIRLETMNYEHIEDIEAPTSSLHKASKRSSVKRVKF